MSMVYVESSFSPGALVYVVPINDQELMFEMMTLVVIS